MTNKGLLVMHYGTPSSLEEVLPYYTHIRHGRPPSDEALQDLVDRYKAIGGPSPLTEISRKQAEAIQRSLAKKGVETNLYIGAKHTSPFIGDAVRQMISDGIEEAIGIVLAPHYSTFSVVAYRKAAQEALEGSNLRLDIIERWGAQPAFIDALAERVQEQLQGWNPQETLVIFSAHSLPQRIVQEGDPYRHELNQTSELVAKKTRIPNWTFAFQSASSTGEPWLGPDILDVIEKAAAEGKYKNILACTVGFVSDHLEVLYDLGIEAKQKCAEVGLEFRRAATIGEDPKVMAALAELAANRFTSPVGGA